MFSNASYNVCFFFCPFDCTSFCGWVSGMFCGLFECECYPFCVLTQPTFSYAFPLVLQSVNLYLGLYYCCFPEVSVFCTTFFPLIFTCCHSEFTEMYCPCVHFLLLWYFFCPNIFLLISRILGFSCFLMVFHLQILSQILSKLHVWLFSLPLEPKGHPF